MCIPKPVYDTLPMAYFLGAVSTTLVAFSQYYPKVAPFTLLIFATLTLTASAVLVLMMRGGNARSGLKLRGRNTHRTGLGQS